MHCKNSNEQGHERADCAAQLRFSVFYALCTDSLAKKEQCMRTYIHIIRWLTLSDAVGQ